MVMNEKDYHGLKVRAMYLKNKKKEKEKKNLDWNFYYAIRKLKFLFSMLCSMLDLSEISGDFLKNDWYNPL